MLTVILENVEGLGPAIVLMLNIVLTAGLINLLIIIPYKVKIKQHLI